MEFKYIAIISCTALLAFLVYKEVTRENKKRLVWRILANLVAVSCFLLLIIPLKYNTTIKQHSDEITILTEGTVSDSVAGLKSKKYRLSAPNQKPSADSAISDLSYFLATNKNIRKLNVYGYGFSNEELKSLTGYELSFHPSPVPEGIISANWTKEIKPTEKLLIQGIYQNNKNKEVKISLKGMGQNLDSVLIPPLTQKQFSFQTQPKQSGKAIYQLIATERNDTISAEPVPFLVKEQAPVKVFMLASSPDFEYNFIKKWLYDNGYPLAFRSQISKNKYSTSFLNTDSLNLKQITTSSLKNFDILMIDEEELAAITPAERSAISLAINNGMGLIIRISETKASTPLSSVFDRLETPSAKNKQLTLLANDENFKFSPLTLEQTLFLKTTSKDRPLVTDLSGKIIVNSSIKGAGKIIASTLSSTFNWMLSGKTDDYTKFWSLLFSQAARKSKEMQRVSLIPQFPTVNQKTELFIELAESSGVPAIKAEGIKLSPIQNIELPFEWNASFWPLKNGWSELNINKSIESFYVYKNTDWQTLKNQQKINSTLQFASSHRNLSAKPSQSTITTEHTVSIWWFFIGFLCASAFLWYELRILSGN